VTLNRLNRAQSADMVDKLTAAMTLPAETADQIVAKSDGVPLFVEELTKAVLEFNAPGIVHVAVPRAVSSGWSYRQRCTIR
jgi:hypothetical protein